jgi:hypothetical protein
VNGTELPRIDVTIDRIILADPAVSSARATRIGALLAIEMRRLLEQQGLSTVAPSAATVSVKASSDPQLTDQQMAGHLARSIVRALRGI